MIGAPIAIDGVLSAVMRLDQVSRPMTGKTGLTAACGPPQPRSPARSRIGLQRLAGTLRKAQPGKGRPLRDIRTRPRPDVPERRLQNSRA